MVVIYERLQDTSYYLKKEKAGGGTNKEGHVNSENGRKYFFSILKKFLK